MQRQRGRERERPSFVLGGRARRENGGGGREKWSDGGSHNEQLVSASTTEVWQSRSSRVTPHFPVQKEVKLRASRLWNGELKAR